jgi:hypothetical protein
MNDGDYKMKLFTIGTLFVLLALGGRASAVPNPDCAWANPAPVCATADPAPSGPSEVIACAAQQYSAKVVPPKIPAYTATEFWETILFNKEVVMDKFCSTPAPDAVAQKAQAEMFK